MITLHHLENSRSQRILWLLEELGVEYQIKLYQRDSKTNLAPKALKDLHPLGKAPVITDGTQVIAESGLIIEYLIAKYGEKFQVAAQSEQDWQVKYWLHYSEGSLMPLMVIKLLFDKIRTAPMPFFIKPIAKAIADKAMSAYAGPNIINNLKYIEQHLADKQWFTGEQVTAADFQMSFPLEAMVAKADMSVSHPSICAFVKRVHARPAYQAGLAKGGDYDYAKPA